MNWAVWVTILFLQNLSFTYVSRARSSGSLYRHFKASIFSNSIWIFSQILLLGPMLEGLLGRRGRLLQFETAAVYTLATVSGSIFAHYWALRTEKGKNAVGFNKKYAQIPIEDWKRVLEMLDDYEDLNKKIAEAGEKATVLSQPSLREGL